MQWLIAIVLAAVALVVGYSAMRYDCCHWLATIQIASVYDPLNDFTNP